MSAERSYGRRELIEAYLAGCAGTGYHGYYQDSSSYNAALKAHHEAMLDGLQRLYGIRLEMGHSPDRVLFVLFDRTAASMAALTTPMSGFLSASLLINRLEAAGEPGARVLEASHRLWNRKAEAAEDHLLMLDELLGLMLGDRAEITFTDADLRGVGVDPVPPNTNDYDLYMD